jgi:hypothetical protein
LDLESRTFPHYFAPEFTLEKETQEGLTVSRDEHSRYPMSTSKLQEAVRRVRACEPYHLRARTREQCEVAIDLLAFDASVPMTANVNGEQLGVEFFGRNYSLFE